MSNFTQEDYEKLNKKEQVMVKYQDRIYEYTLKTNYEEAEYYELNMNAIEECIIIFDIDEEINEEEKEEWLKDNIPEIIRTLPYTLSRTKYMPHYYCILEGITKEILKNNVKISTNCLTFCKGDILASHVWERRENELYNYKGKIPRIHINDIKQYIKKKI